MDAGVLLRVCARWVDRHATNRIFLERQSVLRFVDVRAGCERILRAASGAARPSVMRLMPTSSPSARC